MLHPRAVRRHLAGPDDFAAAADAAGRSPTPRRRGKYLWLPLDDGDALLGPPRDERPAPGRSPAGAPTQPHLRVRFVFADGGAPSCASSTSGCSAASSLVADGGAELPAGDRAHRPRPARPGVRRRPRSSRRLRRRRTGVKRALLDQTLICGIGNIYADEALWRARLHCERPTDDGCTAPHGRAGARPTPAT